eukprot:TRINITY_DN11744_c0_g1_i1.p1 TRINITY_DN11744_c0_g1~~TRINITY_DN11744_c0_g1_i1.p1  ORF type:complete len:206 (+),score=70.98 TRINITY_DN11744_c0_g1_i1:61-678(+)
MSGVERATHILEGLKGMIRQKKDGSFTKVKPQWLNDVENDKDADSDNDKSEHEGNDGEPVKKRAKKEKKEKKEKKKKKDKKKKDKKEKKSEPSESEVDVAKDAILYLVTWKNDRDSWKFRKVRQLWLLHNCFNPLLLPKEYFPTFLEYIAGLRGLGRDETLASAMVYVEAGKEFPEEEAEGKTKKEQQLRSIAFKRAKEICKLLA